MLLVGCWGCLAGVAGGTHSWMLHPNVWASQHLGAAPQHMDHTPGWGHPLSPSHVFLLPPVQGSSGTGKEQAQHSILSLKNCSTSCQPHHHSPFAQQLALP